MLHLKVFLSFLFLATLNVDASGSSAKGNSKRCAACRQLAERVEHNLDATKDKVGHVTVGNGKTVPYARSETRLGDILRGACKGADNPEECNDILTSDAELISEWFPKSPRPAFDSVVCKSPCKSIPANEGRKHTGNNESKKSTGKCGCPFSNWCPCKGECKEGSCCWSQWLECSQKWFNQAKEVTVEYTQQATEQISHYSRLANKQLDKLPIDDYVEKLPYLDRQQKRFVAANWKAIVLTLILLVLTPVYYLLFSGQKRRPTPAIQRTTSRIQSRRRAD